MLKLKFALSRRWPLLLIGLLLGVAAAFVTRDVGVGGGVSYESREIAQLNVDEADSEQSTVTQDAELVLRGEVPQRAAESLGRADEVTELVDRVTAVPDSISFSIEITARQPTAEDAAAVSRAFLDAFVETQNEEHIATKQAAVDRAQAAVDEAKAALDAFEAENPVNPDPAAVPQASVEAERTRLLNDYSSAVAGVSEARNDLRGDDLYSAAGSSEPVALSSLALPESFAVRLAAFVLFALAATLGLIFFVERTNPRLDTREEVVDQLGVPVIGEIGVLPRNERVDDAGSRIDLESSAADGYRRVRSAIQFVLQRSAQAAPAPPEPGMPAELPSKVFLVVSALPNEGKSTSVAMTSLTLAEAGVRTLALGCDYRKSTVDNMLGINTSVGISDRAQISSRRPELSDIIYETPTENLWLAPGGSPAANFAACAEVVGELVAAAREAGISVIIDTTPIAVANDAIDLLPMVDEVILVVRAGHTSVADAQHLLEQLAQHHREILGVVLVGSRSGRDRSAYYDYYRSSEPAGLFGRK